MEQIYTLGSLFDGIGGFPYFTVTYYYNGAEVYSYDSTDAVTTAPDSDGSTVYSFNFDLGNVTFSKVGVYTYTLSEASGNATNMTYSSVTHRVVYTVTDNGDGSLKVEVSGTAVTPATGEEDEDTETSDAAGTVAWTNVYRYVAYSPSITKAVANDSDVEITEIFQFNLYSSDSYSETEDDDGVTTAALTGDPLDTKTLTWSSTATGTVTFEEQTFTTMGTYTYYIQEAVPEEGEQTPGMTYDDSIIRVDVTVGYTSAGALYVSSVRYMNLGTGDYVTFTYTYDEDTETWSYVKSEGEGSDASVITNVYTVTDIAIRKVDAEDNNTILSGAEFRLYQTVDGTKYYYSYDENTKEVTWVTEKESTTTLTSNENGLLTFHNLADGTYYLEETKAPDGYNSLSSDVTITIVNGAVSEAYYGLSQLDVDTTGETAEIIVLNSAGYGLPKTGGIGTALYTVSGLLLMIAAAGYGFSLLRRRERRNAR